MSIYTRQFYNPVYDPVDNSVTQYYHFRSTSKGGSGSGILGADDLTVPASPNYPVNTASRYLIELPGEVDSSDIAGTRPFTAKDETRAQVLTRVDPSATLAANQFKIFYSTSLRRNMLEIHVGVGSSQPGDTVSFEGYFLSTVISQSDMNYRLPQKVYSTLTQATAGAPFSLEVLPFDTSKTSYRFSGRLYGLVGSGAFVITVKTAGAYLAGTAYSYTERYAGSLAGTPFWSSSDNTGAAYFNFVMANNITSTNGYSFTGSIELINGILHIIVSTSKSDTAPSTSFFISSCAVTGMTNFEGLKIAGLSNAVTVNTASRIILEPLDV